MEENKLGEIMFFPVFFFIHIQQLLKLRSLGSLRQIQHVNMNSRNDNGHCVEETATDDVISLPLFSYMAKSVKIWA